MIRSWFSVAGNAKPRMDCLKVSCPEEEAGRYLHVEDWGAVSNGARPFHQVLRYG